jgi:hypothetical protein
MACCYGFLFGPRCKARREVGWVRKVQDVLDLTVREPNLIVPPLEQALAAVALAYALRGLAQTLVLTHRPVLHLAQTRQGVVHGGEGHVQPGVQFLKPGAQAGGDVLPSGRVVGEGLAQGLPGAGGTSVRFLGQVSRLRLE